jgi:hypothetical protein
LKLLLASTTAAHANQQHCTLPLACMLWCESRNLLTQLFIDLWRAHVAAARVNRPDPFNFLISLCWLKDNDADEKLAGQIGMNETAARKWKWCCAKKIAAMKEEKASVASVLIRCQLQMTALISTVPKT